MQRPAPVWKRILAFLVDFYLGVMLFASFILLMNVPDSFTEGIQFTPLAVAALVYIGIFMLLYHTFCEYIVGQTPGMMLFRIEVKSKKPLRFWQALVRNLFLLPLFPFNLLWLVEPLYYFFQGERLLERWTHTETVQ